jgi:tetratricopeptide (TPR) repeat protein
LLVNYWIHYHLFGLNPAPWHASIVAVNLLATWLVFKIARRLTGESTPALLAASLFAVTPIHAAAVVWMAASGMVLSTTLSLVAFYLIMQRANGSVRNWAAAIACYAGALLCHESAIAFPAVVACYAFLFAESDRDSLWMRARRAVIWQAPFAFEVILYLVLRRLVLGFFVSNPYDYANLLTNAQDVLTVPLVLATYLAMLTMPWLTMPNHAVFPVSSVLSPEFWLPLATIVLLGATFLVIERRDPRRRLHLFCAAWIGVTLAPMMLLHSVYHLVQDFYLYLPSVGWCLLVADLIVVFARKNAFARRLAFGGGAAMLVICAMTLWRMEPFWHDDIAAAGGYVEGDPESTAWRVNLASSLEQAGDLTRAEEEMRTAIRLQPDITGTLHPGSRVLHRILGDLLVKSGDIGGAESEFRISASAPSDEGEPAISAARRDYIQNTLALYHRGVRDQEVGRTDQALSELTEGIAIMNSVPSRDFGPVAMRYIPLLQLYDSLGNSRQVESILKEVDSMPEGELAVGWALAEIRLQHSDKRGAEQILRKLADRYPDNDALLMKLGNLQADLKQNEQALDSYRRISHWLGHPNLYAARAKSLHALGRDHEALEQCELALASAPPNDRETQFVCLEIRNEAGNK